MGPGPTELRILDSIEKNGPTIAALIDPEEFSAEEASSLAKTVEATGVGVIFVGGSTIADQSHLDDVVMQIKRNVTVPVILFPGNITGISKHADAILFSSLLNSSNTYFIIGAQALGAMQVKQSSLEAIPMGYLVFREESTTGFVGQVRGIPYEKPLIAVMYALAAYYLGMRTLYLEAGSGSNKTMPPELVSAVRQHFPGLLVVGGGITDSTVARALAGAGADILVVGNLLEEDDFRTKLSEIVSATKKRL